MALFKPQRDVSLLLVGKTGVGKSSTANTILGKKSFKSSMSLTSVTKNMQVDFTKLMGYNVTVVDGPGLKDTDQNEEESVKQTIQSAVDSLAACPWGYDAVLIIIYLGRQTAEDLDSVRQLKAIYGEHFIRDYGILVITHGDNFEEEVGFKQWCRNQTGSFKELMHECCERAILFDNKTKDRQAIDEQISKLFDALGSLKDSRNRYGIREFSANNLLRDQELVRARKPIIEQTILRDIKLIHEDLTKIELKNSQDDLVLLREFKTKANQCVEQVKKEDNSTGALKEVIDYAQNVLTNVQDKIEQTHAFIEKKKAIAELEAEMTELGAANDEAKRKHEAVARQLRIDVENIKQQYKE